MSHRVLGVGCPVRVRRPARIDLVTARAGDGRGPGRRARRRPVRRELDGIGNHKAVTLIDQHHGVAAAGIERKGAQQLPRPAIGFLVHRHRGRTTGVVHRIHSMGAAVGVLGPAGIHLVTAGVGDGRGPGERVGTGPCGLRLIVGAEVAADRSGSAPRAGEGAREVIDDDGGGFLAIGAVHLIVAAQKPAHRSGGGPGAGDGEAGVRVVDDYSPGRAAIGFVVLVVAALVTRNGCRCRPGADHREAGIGVVNDDGGGGLSQCRA